MDALRVNLVQLDAGPTPGPNLERIRALLAGAPPADLVALPEVFTCRGNHEDYGAAAEAIPGSQTDWLGRLARDARAWVLGGSIIERAGADLFNTAVLVNPAGTIVARYRKVHLFEATLEDGRVIRESDTYRAGDEPVMAELNGWRVGLSICYDLRFPELFRHYAQQGAQLLLIPSNFTQRTGQDHWEILVRARAIENQCFVVAPDQCGLNRRSNVASYGHSMAVDPWGAVLARAGAAEEVVAVQLDPARLHATRARIPVLSHRRL